MMDVEAAARALYEHETRYHMTDRVPFEDLLPGYKQTWIRAAKLILKAAGVPEMEAQCAALRRAIDELRHDFYQCVDAVVARAERAEKRLEAAERVCKAAIAWVDDGADYGLDSWQELIDAVKAYRRLASGRR